MRNRANSLPKRDESTITIGGMENSTRTNFISKFDYNRLTLMRCGLDLGVAKLTEEELADCFDEICMCGKAHDGEKLRKLRTRTIEMVRRPQKVASPPLSE